MRIDLNLDPHDPSLAPLRSAWHDAARAHAGHHEALAARAVERYAQVASRAMPGSVREPLALVPQMARMLTNRDFEIDPHAREQVAGALAYFVDPNDLMPDDDGHFGYLDDALVLKLALAEASHEWFAWCDYRDYIDAYPEEHGIDRATWMERRRERLATELRRRSHGGYGPDARRERSYSEGYAPAARNPMRFGIR